MFFCEAGFNEPRAAAESAIQPGSGRRGGLVTATSPSQTFPVTMSVDEIYLGDPVRWHQVFHI